MVKKPLSTGGGSFEKRINEYIKDSKDTIDYLVEIQSKILDLKGNESSALPDEYKAFLKFADYFLNEEYNPYSEAEGFTGSASSLEMILHNAHHAFIDDGDIYILNNKAYGPVLFFGDFGMEDKKSLDSYLSNRYKHYVNSGYTMESMYLEEHVDKWIQYKEDHRLYRIESDKVLEQQFERLKTYRESLKE